MSLELVLTDTPAPEVRAMLLQRLDAANSERASWRYEPRTLAVLLRETGSVVGGLWANTNWAWLSVELLFVPERLRGSGLGRRLMRQAEDEAVRRGCRAARVDTFSFQARGFYEKLGYRVYGTLEDCPPGHSRYFLQKTLTPPG